MDWARSGFDAREIDVEVWQRVTRRLLRGGHTPMIQQMDAAILAIGSELLGTDKLDTNSLKITLVLERFGFRVVEKSVVGDDEAHIADALARLVDRARVVIVTGGLGPTRDDCTRGAVARAFGLDVTIDETVVEDIRRKFASFGRVMPDVNRRQGEVLAGASLLSNPRGTAPGQRLNVGDATIMLLPGVPREVKGMLLEHVEPWLRTHGNAADGDVVRHTLRVACLPESTVEERLAPFYERFGRDDLGVLARPGDVRLVLRLPGDRSAEASAMLEVLRKSIGDAIYSENGEQSLAAVVVAELRRGGFELAVAESCTGGMVSEQLTRVPGSSRAFLGGAVTYANALKTGVVGVPEAMIASEGAVSEAVARAMATGARQRFGADFGLAITGVAGPGGGTEAKPVGTVHLAIAGPIATHGEVDIVHKARRFVGDRQMVREQSTQMALDMLRRVIPKEPGGA